VKKVRERAAKCFSFLSLRLSSPRFLFLSGIEPDVIGVRLEGLHALHRVVVEHANLHILKRKKKRKKKKRMRNTKQKARSGINKTGRHRKSKSKRKRER
jgi:hypothetical protein